MPTLLLAAPLLSAQADAAGPKTKRDVDKVQSERWQKYDRAVAAGYEMDRVGGSRTGLTLRPDPVLSYANPAGGSRSHGAMFVWTRDGRPEVLGAIWSRQSGDRRFVVHELHSLSLEPLTATRDGRVYWSPKGPGVEPFPIPGAPAPAATPPLRLAQMRGLARDFSATTVRQTVERPLQFRPQPVYRFEPPTAERDGAVFVAFENWDPELLMVIETRATPTGPRWHAGFARFMDLPVSARHKGVPVWGFQENASENALGGPDQRFNVIYGVEVLPAVREE